MFRIELHEFAFRRYWICPAQVENPLARLTDVGTSRNDQVDGERH